MDVALKLPKHSYTVYIDTNLLESIGERIKDLTQSRNCLTSKVLIVADSNTAPLYLAQVKDSLLKQGFKVSDVILPAGEIFKTASSVELIWEKALDSGLDRKSLMLALGGGVIGDLTGFAAATYLRGVKFLSIPTTLLSQVDASVGGKTGFNLRSGKNLVGAFYQPIGVFADTSTLLSLPEREYINGYAEIVKHALICDNDLLEFLERNLEKIKNRDSRFLAWLVEKNVRVKASVVAADEKETGMRAILNLGHTLGHALEEIGDYKVYYHGEAVAIGMVVACAISLNRGLITERDFARVTDLLKEIGLPRKPIVGPEPKLWWEKTFRDKKASEGVVYWVLPRKKERGGTLQDRFDRALYGNKVEYNEFYQAVDLIKEG